MDLQILPKNLQQAEAVEGQGLTVDNLPTEQFGASRKSLVKWEQK